MASFPPALHDRLVVATTNRGKLSELRHLLSGLPLVVQSVDDVLPDPPQVIEDGATFAENAVKKARAVARATRMLSLADDSGLEVDALDGRPGVRSARFAHDLATDEENNAALLAALAAWERTSPLRDDGRLLRVGARTAFRARFRCVLALFDPLAASAEPLIVEGVCEGAIARAPRGSGGFGYDPLFVPAKSDKTLAQLSPEGKNRVSHRALAFAALRPSLENLLRERALRQPVPK